MKDYSWRAFRSSEALLAHVLLIGMLLTGGAAYVAICNTLRPETPALLYWIRTSAFLATFLIQIMACARPLEMLHPWLSALRRNFVQLAAMTLVLSLVHATSTVYQYHGGGNVPALLSLADLSTDDIHQVLSGRAPIRDLPFEAFGALALLALIPLATPVPWVIRGRFGSELAKYIEPLLYPAYGATLVHIGLGIVQAEGHLIYFILLGIGLALFLGLHAAAALIRRLRGSDALAASASGAEHAPESGLQSIFGTTRIYLLVMCPVYMALLAVAQPAVQSGHYEKDQRKTLEGVYYASPAPMLQVTPEWSTSPTDAQEILLCGQGKHGLPSEWSQAEGKRIRLHGRLLYRDTLSMVEVEGEPEILGDPEEHQRSADPSPGEPVSVSGELVDMKCYLGYMSPAEDKLHRACTIRCLSGGIAPGIVLGMDRSTAAVLLCGPQGKPLDFDTSLGGYIVQVDGTLFRLNGYAYICADSMRRRDTDR